MTDPAIFVCGKIDNSTAGCNCGSECGCIIGKLVDYFMDDAATIGWKCVGPDADGKWSMSRPNKTNTDA